jgi:2-polyprenyl-6-methoxyphenol hydroxylase-like FAD-dependent oxidoreductase
MDGGRRARRAAVIGGSLAGLCAARVLADHFEGVTVVERDAYPDGARDRPGCPQGRHVHALLARGRRELETLFPGFDQAMLARGALDLDFGLDFAALRIPGWAPREPSSLRLLFASRSLIDAVLRDFLRRHSNVAFLERSEAVELLAAGSARGDAAVVRGVEVRPRDGGRLALEADLVVDASGRASKVASWLRALGLQPPRETVVDSFAGYSTRWYRMPDAARWPQEWWWKGIWIDAAPPEHLSAGVLFPVEGRRWIATVASAGRRYPPSDEVGFREWIERLRSPLMAEALRLAEPISPVYGARAMANRFRHFEAWRVPLDGFVAIGDAVCAFNPVYGQGMTTAAACAAILRDVLERRGPGHPHFARDVFRAQARLLRDPWAFATGADLQVPESVGDRPLAAKLVGPYMESLFRSAWDDRVLRDRLVEVLNLVRPASDLFTLGTLARVARGALERRLGLAGIASAIPPRPPVGEATPAP